MIPSRVSAYIVSASVALSGLMLSVPAAALIDMRNANFSETWNDIEVPGTGYDLRVTRTYNSRSLYEGNFGFGWCSNFETKLDIRPEGTLRIAECGDGLDVVYVPKQFKPDSIDKAVDEIIKAEKESNPKVTERTLNDLRVRLKAEQGLRVSYAQRLKLKNKATDEEGTEYTIADGPSSEKVYRKRDHYLRNFVDGTSQKFDTAGRLIQMFDKSGNFIKFTYRSDILADATDNNGRKLNFSFVPNTKRIKEITGPSGFKATYAYQGSNLSRASSADGEVYDYKYDEVHNMTEIKTADGKTKQLRYDTNKDWVTSLKDIDGCLETYEYTVAKDDPRNHYWSTVVKKCEDKVTNRSRFEFWYKDTKDGRGNYLEKVLTEVNQDKTEVVYHAKFGRPISVKRNGQLSTYAYNDAGLVKSKVEGKVATQFEYDKRFNKVSVIKSGKRSTSFDYDEKANLVVAKNSDGQLVRLGYDEKGRIVSLVDQAKRRVNIDYEERFGKPSFVERPGVGAISVSYKPNGQINKIDSKDGPAVAVQVASAFNNLLEIVSPAGVDLGL
jgi:YD repeat-containing protein